MHLPVQITPESDGQEIAKAIEAIDVSAFDNERNRLRHQMVVQRFTLGLVELFEKFPDLPHVIFLPHENVATMIQPPLGQMEDDALARKIQKNLQSARSRLCPQSSATRDSLALFLGNAFPLEVNRRGRGTSRASRLDREVFCRDNLVALCSLPAGHLNPEAAAGFRALALSAIAESARPSESGAKPKMKM